MAGLTGFKGFISTSSVGSKTLKKKITKYEKNYFNSRGKAPVSEQVVFKGDWITHKYNEIRFDFRIKSNGFSLFISRHANSLK